MNNHPVGMVGEKAKRLRGYMWKSGKYKKTQLPSTELLTKNYLEYPSSLLKGSDGQSTKASFSMIAN